MPERTRNPKATNGPGGAGLDQALAQTIVDRSMRIIDCNVNVMDARGTIIASGDRDRIGDVHDGALLVLARQAGVEIDARLADQLGTVRQGVNLPLHAAGRIVGCIGLTGSPRAIRAYAELVRMAAETMLEQAQSYQLVTNAARLRERFVLDMVSDERSNTDLAETASRLGIDLATPRVATIVEIRGAAMSAEAMLSEQNRLCALLATPERGNLIAAIAPDQILVLKPALNARGVWSLDMHRERAEALLDRAGQVPGFALRFAMGRYFPAADELPRSLQTARATLEVGKTFTPHARTFFFDDMRLSVLLHDLQGDWRAEELYAPVRALMDARHPELIETLRTWFACGMHKVKAAERLQIHRNSLDYRMTRIARICGVDLSRSEGVVSLYLALRISDTSPPRQDRALSAAQDADEDRPAGRESQRRQPGRPQQRHP
jgi:carbohydrate diacid regulator